MHQLVKKLTRLVGTFMAVLIAGVSYAATATFDSFEEGGNGIEFVDGGIRFFNPLENNGSMSVFAIDDASGNLGDSAYFTGPNGLGIGGLAPGPIGGGASFLSMEFALADGGLANVASVDLFLNGVVANNAMVLLAFLDGNLVASDSVSGPINCCDFYAHLSIEEVTFDSLMLASVGTGKYDVSFVLVDNVHISQVPLPGSLLLMLSSLLGAISVARTKS